MNIFSRVRKPSESILLILLNVIPIISDERMIRTKETFKLHKQANLFGNKTVWKLRFTFV